MNDSDFFFSSTLYKHSLRSSAPRTDVNCLTCLHADAADCWLRFVLFVPLQRVATDPLNNLWRRENVEQRLYLSSTVTKYLCSCHRVSKLIICPSLDWETLWESLRVAAERQSRLITILHTTQPLIISWSGHEQINRWSSETTGVLERLGNDGILTADDGLECLLKLMFNWNLITQNTLTNMMSW